MVYFSTGPGYNTIWGLVIIAISIPIMIWGILNEFFMIGLIVFIIGIGLILYDLYIRTHNNIVINWKTAIFSLIGFTDQLSSPVGVSRESVLVEEGLKLSDEQNYSDALAKFEEAIEINPDFAPSWCYKSLCHIMFGDFALALKSVDKAIQREPSNPLFYNCKSVLFYHLDLLKNSLEWIDEALKLDTENDTALCNKGIILEELEDYTRSVDYLNRSLKLNPNNIFSIVTLGIVNEHLGNTNESILLFKKALNIEIIGPEEYTYRGIALTKLGKFEKAIEELKKSADKFPYYLITWKYLKSNYEAIKDQNEFNEASNQIEILRKMIEEEKLKINVDLL